MPAIDTPTPGEMAFEFTDTMLPSFQMEPMVLLPGIEIPAPEVGAMTPVDVIDRLAPDVIVWIAATVVPVMVLVVCATPGDGSRIPAMTIKDAPASIQRRVEYLLGKAVDIIVLA